MIRLLTFRRSSKRISKVVLLKRLKLWRSQWYSTFDADEDRTTKNNCSDIWSGLEIEKFKREIDKERYKNAENVADK